MACQFIFWSAPPWCQSRGKNLTSILDAKRVGGLTSPKGIVFDSSRQEFGAILILPDGPWPSKSRISNPAKQHNIFLFTKWYFYALLDSWARGLLWHRARRALISLRTYCAQERHAKVEASGSKAGRHKCGSLVNAWSVCFSFDCRLSYPYSSFPWLETIWNCWFPTDACDSLRARISGEGCDESQQEEVPRGHSHEIDRIICSFWLRTSECLQPYRTWYRMPRPLKQID